MTATPRDALAATLSRIKPRPVHAAAARARAAIGKEADRG